MGNQQIVADGQRHEFDEETTIAEVKAAIGAAENDLATYVDEDGSWVALSDRDPVAHVPDGTQVAFQPQDTYFGAEATDR